VVGDPRVRIAFNGQRLGPATSRNRALARAAARYVQNLDVDDQLLPGALTTLAALLDRHAEAAFAFGCAVDAHPDGTTREIAPPFAPGLVVAGHIPACWRSEAGDYRVPIHPAGIMWRRETLFVVGGWTALWAVDDTALLMAASALFDAVCTHKPTFLYRRHAAQLSARAEHLAERLGEQIAFIGERVACLERWR
jgi:hypothetical protein